MAAAIRQPHRPCPGEKDGAQLVVGPYRGVGGSTSRDVSGIASRHVVASGSCGLCAAIEQATRDSVKAHYQTPFLDGSMGFPAEAAVRTSFFLRLRPASPPSRSGMTIRTVAK